MKKNSESYSALYNKGLGVNSDLNIYSPIKENQMNLQNSFEALKEKSSIDISQNREKF